MKWTECKDRSDGFMWECRKQIGRKRHRCQTSIREGSWFEDLKQWQIKQQLGLGLHTAVDWDMFCREVCGVALFDLKKKSAAQGSWSRLIKVRLGKESIIVDMLLRVSGFLVALRKIPASVSLPR